MNSREINNDKLTMITKNKDISGTIKIRTVKAVAFLEGLYGCESCKLKRTTSLNYRSEDAY